MRRANGRPLRLLLLDTLPGFGGWSARSAAGASGQDRGWNTVAEASFEGAARSTLRNAQYGLYL